MQLELGMKFTSSTAGQVTALKFYRSPSDTGNDLLSLERDGNEACERDPSQHDPQAAGRP